MRTLQQLEQGMCVLERTAVLVSFVGLLLLGVLLILASLVGTPLFIIFGSAAWLFFWLADIDPAAIMIELYRLAQMPTLMSIPLFTFSGYVLASGQAPQRLVRMAWLC